MESMSLRGSHTVTGRPQQQLWQRGGAGRSARWRWRLRFARGGAGGAARRHRCVGRWGCVTMASGGVWQPAARHGSGGGQREREMGGESDGWGPRDGERLGLEKD